MQIVHVLAARPNFIKAAPVISELANKGHTNCIIHTNQHYDFMMSKVFFEDLNIPEPDYHLGIRSGTHGVQTGTSIIEIEKVLMKEKPDIIIVYGDVNSTLAGALAAAKLNIPIHHIESGCRSYDRAMPEEVNRILVDSISTELYCTEVSAYNNLIELYGELPSIHLVGNTAIDTLHTVKNKLVAITPGYYLCTLHRPFNVDSSDTLNTILDKLEGLDKPVIIPAHPRLKNNIDSSKQYNNIQFIEPLGYIKFISYIKYSSGVISDSGGIQCEAAFFNIPTLTLRPTTEHMLTLKYGNKLGNVNDIKPNMFNKIKEIDTPFEWDGKASKRIAEIIG